MSANPKPKRSTAHELALLLTVAPLAAAAMAVEARCARWWPLRFPRSIAELEQNPQALVDLLTAPSRGLLAPLQLPSCARMVSLHRSGQLTHEPDKNRTTAPLTLQFAGPSGTHAVRVVVKF